MDNEKQEAEQVFENECDECRWHNGCFIPPCEAESNKVLNDEKYNR